MQIRKTWQVRCGRTEVFVRQLKQEQSGHAEGLSNRMSDLKRMCQPGESCRNQVGSQLFMGIVYSRWVLSIHGYCLFMGFVLFFCIHGYCLFMGIVYPWVFSILGYGLSIGIVYPWFQLIFVDTLGICYARLPIKSEMWQNRGFCATTQARAIYTLKASQIWNGCASQERVAEIKSGANYSWVLSIHGFCLFMGIVYSWVLSIHGYCLFMGIVYPWVFSILGYGLSIGIVYPWFQLIFVDTLGINNNHTTDHEHKSKFAVSGFHLCFPIYKTLANQP